MKYISYDKFTGKIISATSNPQDIMPEDTDTVGYLEYDHTNETHVVDGIPVVQPPTDEEAWEMLRERRDKRLQATDWTQMADQTAERRELWTPYRQALRDLPANTVDPHNPVWPVPPAEAYL